MEPKNHPIEKENHLNQTSIFWFKMLIFQGVDLRCQISAINTTWTTWKCQGTGSNSFTSPYGAAWRRWKPGLSLGDVSFPKSFNELQNFWRKSLKIFEASLWWSGKKTKRWDCNTLNMGNFKKTGCLGYKSGITAYYPLLWGIIK